MVFVTNNASATPAQIVAELADVDVPATPGQIVTSAMAAAALLDPGTRCLVIGMDGLRAALDDRRCLIVTDPRDADAVVVGFDRRFTWEALRDANAAIRNGARFIATNTDATFPAADGIWPGNGAVVAAIATATGTQPEVAGKPHTPLLEAAAARAGRTPVLMVGDRFETDIAGAAALGWDTALVLTGITAEAEVAGLSPAPTYVLRGLAQLLESPPSVTPAGPMVRTARRADVPAIVRLWEGAGMLAYTSEPERDLHLVMSTRPELLVVADDGAVVGVALGTFDGRRGWLMRVAVDPPARRRGIGRAMVAEVEARMQRIGAPQIDLLTFEDNQEARDFWVGLGYRTTSPVALFVKPLGPQDSDAC